MCVCVYITVLSLTLVSLLIIMQNSVHLWRKWFSVHQLPLYMWHACKRPRKYRLEKRKSWKFSSTLRFKQISKSRRENLTSYQLARKITCYILDFADCSVKNKNSKNKPMLICFFLNPVKHQHDDDTNCSGCPQNGPLEVWKSRLSISGDQKKNWSGPDYNTFKIARIIRNFLETYGT